MSDLILCRTCHHSMRYGGKDTLYCIRYGWPVDRTELILFRAYTYKQGMVEYHCGLNGRAPAYEPKGVVA